MTKFMKHAAAVSIFVFSVATALQAQDANGENKQLSEELNKREKALQEQVLEIDKRFSQYSVLKDWDLRYSPVQTRLKKTEEYVELEAYAFIPRFAGSPVLVGKKSRIMRLYFSGSEISKIENIFEELNFEKHTRNYTSVIDPSPLSEDTADIEVQHIEISDFSVEKPLEDPRTYKTTLGKMANSVSQPLRIRFLRDFYVTQLSTFETLFAGTKALQERFGTNNDVTVIKSLEKAMTVH